MSPTKSMVRLGRRIGAEPRILAAIGLLAGSVLLFAKITEDVFNSESGAFDTSILMAMRRAGDLSVPVGPAWLKSAMIDITALGGTTIITMVTVFAVAYLAAAGRPRLALLTGVAVGSGAILENAMKHAFARPRPDIVPHLVDVHTLSFPSGHAMLSAMAYLSLGALLARAQANTRLRALVFAISLLLTLTIGFSRVYLGVHWPTDVLAGWAAGAAWAILFWFLARWLTAE